MALFFYLMVVILTIIQQTMSQQGNFALFGDTAGDMRFTKSVTMGETPRYIKWTLPDDHSIQAFNKPQREILIFESGIISFGDVVTTNCPPRNFNVLAKTLIAVYWIPAQVTGDDSEIFFRMEKKNNFKTDIDGFVSEINRAKNNDILNKNILNKKDILTVIYITWENLKQFPGILADPGNRLSFQIVILSTASTSYTVNIYRTLDYSRVHDIIRPCRQQALVGLRDVKSNFTYQLTSFFPFKSNNILIHSNIQDFITLGRYVLIIKAVQQINPHLINCNSPLKDSFCKDGVSPIFCNGKEFGIYAHPTFCNKIIFCSPGRQDVETCSVGTGFNPFFRNCDWPGFLRCVDIRIDININLIRNGLGGQIPPFQTQILQGEMQRSIVDLARASSPSTGHPSTVSPINERFLTDILQFAVHNNTCIGRQNATNIVDTLSCNFFIMCTNTRGIRQRCPGNLFYEPKTDSCEFPHKVNCIDGRRFNSTDNVTITTQTPLDICSRAKFGLTADPESCQHYIQCAHGRPFRRKCPTSTYFNITLLQCVHTSSTSCPPTTPHVTASPTTVPFQPSLVIPGIFSICQNATDTVTSSIGIGNTGRIPVPGSCVAFYECKNGVVVDILRCPDGSFFNKEKQECVVGVPSSC